MTQVVSIFNTHVIILIATRWLIVVFICICQFVADMIFCHFHCQCCCSWQDSIIEIVVKWCSVQVIVFSLSLPSVVDCSYLVCCCMLLLFVVNINICVVSMLLVIMDLVDNGCWWWMLLPLSGWLLFVVFICQFVVLICLMCVGCLCSTCIFRHFVTQEGEMDMGMHRALLSAGDLCISTQCVFVSTVLLYLNWLERS